ncbi:Coenzyme gamma-F420-2:alpha-L-glutamate ligase [Lentibacillus sp. JNUCC-1]|uniref:ATP-grasp domain-containing protein n=1 Tax=Lentibacillus sp. JNUCC-1 TaxID=2654513 RepID=UPI001329294D|nr:hypothetical protein [Lentibacillus sp. JNUCC-1]MUV39424.1 Coenzyme gamma-F420-2:alpha-L-glutamate ligase [Lentibacillus sp. JNUCC-1]
MIHNDEEWDQNTQVMLGNDLIIQDANVKLGRDVRVFVVGSEVVGAVLRQSDIDFRANFTLGGSANTYQLSKKDLEMIDKIMHAFDFGMVGIDFLIGLEGQLLFNEIEDIVGSRTLSATTDINILQKYITHIKTNLTAQ